MKKREDANDNQKAIKAVFGKKARLRAIINQAIEQMEDSMDEDTSFEDALAQFSYDFDSLAAEAAAVALGVDLAHYYIRTSSQIESGDVQRIIDEVEFKDRDHCVNKLLEVLRRGDATDAQVLFRDIIVRQKSDFPRMNPAAFKTYLINVNSAMNGDHSIGNAIKKLKSWGNEFEDISPETTSTEAAPAPARMRV
jgi:hypothetical protein